VVNGSTDFFYGPLPGKAGVSVVPPLPRQAGLPPSLEMHLAIRSTMCLLEIKGNHTAIETGIQLKSQGQDQPANIMYKACMFACVVKSHHTR
jgi:hypothetical protein